MRPVQRARAAQARQHASALAGTHARAKNHARVHGWLGWEAGKGEKGGKGGKGGKGRLGRLGRVGRVGRVPSAAGDGEALGLQHIALR